MSDPRLAGLWVANCPGLKQSPVTCFDCGIQVPRRQKCYRLLERLSRYGEQPRVVGYLCRACHQALGPAKRGRYLTRILAVEEKSQG